MRVLERKALPEFKITCNHCFSKLAYTKADEKLQYDNYDGDLHDANYIVCPVCNQKIFTAYDGNRV